MCGILVSEIDGKDAAEEMLIVTGKNTWNTEECAELAKLIISMLVMMVMEMVAMIMMMIMTKVAMVMMFTSNGDKNAVEND